MMESFVEERPHLRALADLECAVHQTVLSSLDVDAPFVRVWGKSEVVRTVKGFDPRFFLYFEETDLCRKITNEGFELWAVGAAFAEHECGASTKQLGVSMAHQCISEHYYPSRFYYLIKHHGWLAATLAEVGTIPLLGVRTLLKRGLGRADDGALKERLAGPILRLPDRVELQ